jgi:hypothetical protein
VTGLSLPGQDRAKPRLSGPEGEGGQALRSEERRGRRKAVFSPLDLATLEGLDYFPIMPDRPMALEEREAGPERSTRSRRGRRGEARPRAASSAARERRAAAWQRLKRVSLARLSLVVALAGSLPLLAGKVLKALLNRMASFLAKSPPKPRIRGWNEEATVFGPAAAEGSRRSKNGTRNGGARRRRFPPPQLS